MKIRYGVNGLDCPSFWDSIVTTPSWSYLCGGWVRSYHLKSSSPQSTNITVYSIILYYPLCFHAAEGAGDSTGVSKGADLTNSRSASTSKLSMGLNPHLSNIILSSSHPLQAVVSIFSPVNTAFAPAMKHRICCSSESVVRPAARRMIVLGIHNLAVAIVLKVASKGDFALSPRGVPLIGTRVLTGKLSG